MMIFAVDPGPLQSGFVVLRAPSEEWGASVLHSGVRENDALLDMLTPTNFHADVFAFEMVQSFGMAVGASVFDTVIWAGRFQQRWRDECKRCMRLPNVQPVFRKDVKMHLCNSMKAKDTNIRQALIDRLGEIGNKKNPGPLYGVKSHAWSALAVAATAAKL